ncbi:DEAD/DEAH box helicase [Flammeovirgaceae bacterium 311]|nr:DEAD/DEAH box helicase [Flammeovirgaceae bacterium 311]
MTFENLGLIEPIQQAVESEGYTTPTPIQQQAIPIVLQQKDLFGCAQTGTGKTAAFAIPILQLLHEPIRERGQRKIKALILTPTRELAIQVADSFAAYGKNLDLRHLVVFGGVKQKAQTDALKAGVDILVATPGRLLDLMNQKFISLEHIKYFVLDEADRMLDMGFIHDIKKVLAKLPAKRQSLFFSATMPPDILTLANTILVNPAKVEVTPVSSTAERIQQSLYFVSKSDKPSLLAYLLEEESLESVLVFTRTKHMADRVAKRLHREGIKAEAIHGNKSQNARQRALSNFTNKEIRVLVATDIAARGIDVEDLSHVINFDLPNVPETYVHRIGRTGRAGASGSAISFCDAEEVKSLQDIHKLIGKKIPVVENHPFEADIHVPNRSSNNSSRSQSSYRSQPATASSSHAARNSNQSAPRNNSQPSPRNSSKRWFGKPRSKNS